VRLTGAGLSIKAPVTRFPPAKLMFSGCGSDSRRVAGRSEMRNKRQNITFDVASGCQEHEGRWARRSC
jgi:hypothetical protein